MLVIVLFFVVKQKTAYEMRISDWSSDVCSSDLDVLSDPDKRARHESAGWSNWRDPDFEDGYEPWRKPGGRKRAPDENFGPGNTAADLYGDIAGNRRSEERRVGNRCVSTC